jgi:hypothetical protein
MLRQLDAGVRFRGLQLAGGAQEQEANARCYTQVRAGQGRAGGRGAGQGEGAGRLK